MLYPSERIRMMQDIKTKLDELKATGLTAFVGSCTRRLIMNGKPEDPFDWTTGVISIRSTNDKRILEAGKWIEIYSRSYPKGQCPCFSSLDPGSHEPLIIGTISNALWVDFPAPDLAKVVGLPRSVLRSSVRCPIARINISKSNTTTAPIPAVQVPEEELVVRW